MDAATADRYLARIGAARAPHRSPEALRDLQVAHLHTVPFENLSIHLGEPVDLDEDALVDKIVTRRRGGFCYELNGLFAALLRSLGYRVTLMQARVPGNNGPAIPFDHLTLRVDLDEPWLVDVGFGKFTQHPLRIDERGEQVDPDGAYTVAEVEYGDFEVRREGACEFIVDPRPRKIAEFVPTCWWHQTSPKSHFTKGDVCSMPVDGGRVTLRKGQLIRTAGDERTVETFDGDAELLAAYRSIFGIELPRLPGKTPNA
ncbi:arylamine N-acetyltransferase [Phytomonospora sp. NPDC050363]|uniref:arylamine N-acetyltransferase family protein n=1 Tax=Phytomonospora sp. NPDC050363 TaxID=3155642 RepID=UPI0033FA623C